MILWINWLSLILQALRLIIAEPGPMPSQFPAISALVAKYAGDQAGKPDPWPIIEEAATLHDQVKAEVEAKFNPKGDAGERTDFWPDLLASAPDPADGDAERTRRDAALLGMSLLEQRGLYALTTRLRDSGTGLCLEPGDGKGLLTPGCRDLARTRALGRVLRARMALSADAGDLAAYRDALGAHLGMTRAVDHQVSLIARLVGVSQENNLFNSLRADMQLGRLPPEQLREVLSLVRSAAEPPSERFWLESMAFDTNAIIAGTHTDDGRGDGFLLVDRWRHIVIDANVLAGFFGQEQDQRSSPIDWPDYGAFLNAGGMLFARRVETQQRADELSSKLVALADKPYRERLDGARAISTWARALPESQPVIANHGAWSADALPAVFRSCADALLLRRGVQIMLAVEAYRAEHGRLPNTLDALVPAFLPGMPSDPFTDAPFVYRITDAKSARVGAGYILYSVWTDGVDNGGKRVPGRTQSSSPERLRQNHDFIINDEQDARNR